MLWHLPFKWLLETGETKTCKLDQYIYRSCWDISLRNFDQKLMEVKAEKKSNLKCHNMITVQIWGDLPYIVCLFNRQSCDGKIVGHCIKLLYLSKILWATFSTSSNWKFLTEKTISTQIHVLIQTLLENFYLIVRTLYHNLRLVVILIIYRVVFLTGPPNFQYQNEKRWAANQRFCSIKFSMYKRSSLIEQHFSF